jgi:hypothetical protein
VSAEPERRFDLNPEPVEPDLADHDHDHATGCRMPGSCMPEHIRPRSRSPRAVQNWVWMPAGERELRRSAGRLTNCTPDYAKHALQHLPPEIKLRLPHACPEDLDFSALFTHCLKQIAMIKGNFPRKWYIGVTANTHHRFFNLGHCDDYECMFVLVAALNSRTTRPLEEALITHYQARLDSLLQNVGPKYKGSMAGSPHFLYVCFASTQDACDALIRRR